MYEEYENIEWEMISLILDNSLNELEVASKICKASTTHMEFKEREKLLNHYKTMKTLIEELKNEIETENTYTSLEKYLNDKEQEQVGMQNAKVDSSAAEIQLKIARLELADQDVGNYQEIQSRNVNVGMLTDEYQDQMWEQRVKLKYVSEWQQAQMAQHELRLHQKKQLKQKAIESYENDLEVEHRVHDELDNFYSMQLGEYIKQLVDWVDKYERDKNSYDAKINKLKVSHATLKEDMSRAKELYARQVAEMQAYDEVKEKRRLEKLHMDHLNKHATKIQAWWKGMMVRCKLGPYKVKKGRGKGKGKKNK